MDEFRTYTPKEKVSLKNKRYHVFLSFRGKDTRENLVAHLFEWLSVSGVRVFIDSKRIHKGENLGFTLKEAIKETDILIPIFSPSFAQSRWCLWEVKKMVKYQGLVIPLFCGVEPADVKYPETRPKYRNAFKAHRSKGRVNPEKINQWKAALEKVASKSGWSTQSAWHEMKFIRKVVSDVLETLNIVPLDVPRFAIGLKERMDAVINLMGMGNREEVVTVGIWGAPGVGKSTLARAVYNVMFREFEVSTFASDVAAYSQTVHGLCKLQKQLLRDLLKWKSKECKINSVYHGKAILKEHLQSKSALVILDNVSDRKQLEMLGVEWLGEGSRVIVTIRDKSILTSGGNEGREADDQIYALPELRKEESLQLFSYHAFLKAYPDKGYKELSEKIVDVCGGLPFSLEVVGSFLYRSKDKRCWNEVLGQLRSASFDGIYRTLKIIYQDLSEDEKQIFLDIACFFVGQNQEIAISFWEDLNLNPYNNLSNLVHKALIKIDTKQEPPIISMHDHLRDLGRAIVADESRDPSKRSRLWKAEEAYQVFHHESGFESVQSVSLLGLKRSSTVLAGNSASAKNLQLLWLGDNTIQGDLQPLTSNLRWLSWNSCSLRFLPAQWNMEHLVILDLSSSNRFSSPLTRIWNEESGDKHPKNLSVLLLRRCRLLQTLPDLSNYTRLLRVDLEDCSGLTEIPQSIELLVHLKWLNLWGCEGLEGLPESISKLSSLEKFYVNDCSSITTLPKTLGELTALKELHLRGLVQIEHLPPFQTGCCLQRLVLSGCRTLRNLHPSIGDLKQLTYLEMNKCSTISQLPQEFGNLESLKKLLLNECSRLRELPETFGNLRNLVALELKNTLCSKLPENFCNLESLVHFDASFSHLAFLPEAIDKLSSLEILNLQGTFIEGLPETVKQLGKLKTLVLNQCNKLTLLPTLPEALVNLEAHKCNVIKELPLLSSLESLAKLDIRGSINIKNIAGLGLGSLKSLQCLYLSGSDSIGFNLTRVVKAMQLFWWSITEKTEDQTLDSESSKDIVSFSVVSNSRCAGLLLLFEMEFDPKGAMQIGFVVDEEQSIEGPTVDIEGGEQFILIFRATHPLVVALEKARNLCVRAKGNGIRIRFVEIYVGIEIEDTRFNLKNRYWRSNIFNPYLTIGGMPFAHRRGYNLIYKSVLVSPDDTSGLLVPSLCTNIANIATREPRLLRQRGNTLVGSDRHFHHSTTKMMVSPHCHSLISFHNRGNSLT